MSGLPIDSPFNSLLMIAHVVSKMGINNKSIGIINEDNVTFLNPNKAIIEMIYPKNMLPVSPAKIFAGGKL